MAVTQRQRTVVNSAKRKNGPRRKLSRAQIAAGFGGKRKQTALKTSKPKRKHVPARKAKKNKARKASAPMHRPRTAPRRKKRAATRKNFGKIISFTLPKENPSVAKATKKNRKRPSRKGHSHSTKRNGRRSSRRNPSMGNLTGLVSSAVFVVAGAVGAKYLTQMVLQDKNTGVMGYLGNLVSAFLLSWGVKAFMHNPAAATSVLSGGIVQVVLRLIADYTPFGQYTASLGMGDYLAQNFVTPQRLGPYNPHSAALATTNMPVGMAGCNGLYGGNGLYCAA